MKKDIVWLDYARTIGIFLVVFGHVLQQFSSFEGYGICKTLWNYIYLFHMPLFFIISGFLFKNDGTKSINVKMGGGMESPDNSIFIISGNIPSNRIFHVS